MRSYVLLSVLPEFRIAQIELVRLLTVQYTSGYRLDPRKKDHALAIQNYCLELLYVSRFAVE